MRVSAFLLASGVLVSFGLGTASAGPCSDQIAELSRSTGASGTPAMTGATSGAAAGARPGEASQTGTGATREMSAAAGQVATSPEDVRRQQEGRPTTAQAADQASDRLPMAKAKLEQARLLDEKGDAGCMALVNEARAAMQAK